VGPGDQLQKWIKAIKKKYPPATIGERLDPINVHKAVRKQAEGNFTAARVTGIGWDLLRGEK